MTLDKKGKDKKLVQRKYILIDKDFEERFKFKFCFNRPFGNVIVSIFKKVNRLIKNPSAVPDFNEDEMEAIKQLGEEIHSLLT